MSAPSGTLNDTVAHAIRRGAEGHRARADGGGSGENRRAAGFHRRVHKCADSITDQSEAGDRWAVKTGLGG